MRRRTINDEGHAIARGAREGRVEQQISSREVKRTHMAVNGSSRYAQYMNSRGREIFGGEIDVELADAMRSVATARGTKVTQLFREVLRDFVNENGHSYEFKDASSASEKLKQENAALAARLAALEAKLEELVGDEDEEEEEVEA